MVIDTKVNWYHRNQPLLHKGWFYVPEQRTLQATSRVETAHLLIPETDNWQAEWILRSWNVALANPPEAPNVSIPGNPLAFTANGELITQEVTNNGLLRLNLLALDAGNANLLHSHELHCQSHSQVVWASDAIYVHCVDEANWPRPLLEDSVNREDNAEEPIDLPEPTTQLLRLNPSQGFTEEGNWTFEGYQAIYVASSNVVLLAKQVLYDFGLEGGTVVDVATVESKVRSQMVTRLPNHQNLCEIYQLRPDNDPVLLKQLKDCFSSHYYNETIAMTPTQIWMAKGFAGIKTINW